MNIIDIAYALTAPVEAVMFFMMMDGFFERRKQFPVWQYLLGISVLTVLIRLNNIYLFFNLSNVIGIIISVVVVSLYFFQTSFRKRIILPVIICAIWSAIETLILISITLIFDVTTASDVINVPNYVVFGILTSKFIQFMLTYIVYIRGSFKQFELNKAYYIMFLVLFFSATCTSYLIFWTMNEMNDQDYNTMAMFCGFTLYISTFLAFYLFVRSQRQNQIIRYQEQAEQQMRFQLQHMDETILSQNKLRAMRHDMNSHLIALKSFFDARDFKGGSRYIENLDAQFQQAALSVNTGNNALDSVLSAKRSLAESKDVAFHTKIKIQENLPIAPEDCSIIFGNALDNAIEACERLPADAEKSINLFLQQDATTIFCKITNTALPNTEKTFLTSKADKANHGFGMKNIKEALEKYPSLYNFKQQENQFEFSFSVFY